MKHLISIITLVFMLLPTMAQEGGRTLKPNYRKIARVTQQAGGQFHLDTLTVHFSRADTTMTVDHFRCLYFGGSEGMLTAAHNTFRGLSSRFGMTSRQAGEAWWRYQMLLSAVWSTGDGSRRHPLHVTSMEDAAQTATDFGSALWFKVRGKCRKINVAPQR